MNPAVVQETVNNRAPHLAPGVSQDGRWHAERPVEPGYAKYLLDECNTHNRPLNQGTVARYARDMTAGRWNPNGNAIVLSTEGLLLNGQHRLAAVVKSGVTVQMLFGYNYDPAWQENMDVGRGRQFADTLALRGVLNSRGVAALARKVWAWERGERLDSIRETPTRKELSEFLDRNPAIHASVAAVQRIRLPSTAPTILGLCHWLFSAIDADACETFFARLHDGANLDVGNPIYMLRKLLMEQRGDRAAIKSGVATAYVIKAWNAYRDGRTVKTLRIRLRGDEPEAFPEPR